MWKFTLKELARPAFYGPIVPQTESCVYILLPEPSCGHCRPSLLGDQEQRQQCQQQHFSTRAAPSKKPSSQRVVAPPLCRVLADTSANERLGCAVAVVDDKRAAHGSPAGLVRVVDMHNGTHIGSKTHGRGHILRIAGRCDNDTTNFCKKGVRTVLARST